MVDNTTELLSLIVKAMSEKGIELYHVDLYEQAVSINKEVKVCIGHNWVLVHKVDRGGGISYYSTVGMLDKVLELLTENDWLPGDDIEAYGEWFTLVVEESSYYAEKNEYQAYRLLDENYSLSERMTLEDLKNNYTNVSLEKRLK
ncbi:hypothetical protein HOT02_gp023 [Staphylococcus phage phiSA_BS2]|uniref:Uncharacterized protein n=1 Tax=Staphylococcus phage phiSA_BS2 TaxID=2126724 RepID=A0A2R3ZXI3_9CAUD|nr:hypothetical protein HOT02_gp023 [Staphylococcus phage phiSA_BS2]AVR55468.1 hypothetical protein phiSABS2_23 [Staphylococcus phage phiSA_BS2]